ncbi:hypothetical protein RCZ04_07920 [Capnocytophaga sp. HP1101]
MISSCGSKDDDTPAPPQKTSSLIGAWQMESATLDGKELKLSECSLKNVTVFTENTVEELVFMKYDEYNCTYKKQGAKPYTVSGATITAEGKRLTFTVTEDKLVTEGTELDKEGKTHSFSYTHKRITDSELAALRAMEYKPTAPDYKKQLVGAWQVSVVIIDNKEQEISDCDKKQTFVFTEQTAEELNFDIDTEGKCTYKKSVPQTYTISGTTVTVTVGSTAHTFVIENNQLVYNTFGTDTDTGAQKAARIIYRKLSDSELAALRALEYKAPETITDPKALVGAWQMEKASLNVVQGILERCDEKAVVIFTATTIQHYDFDFNDTTQRCEFERGRAVPYTASAGVFTSAGDTPENFFVRGNRLTVSLIDEDEDGNEGKYEYVYRKLTAAELAEVEKLEKK